MFIEYVLKYHLQDCLNILSEKDNLGYFSIKIDLSKLLDNYGDIGNSVLYNPIETLPACNRDIIKAQQNIIEKDEYKDLVSKLDYCNLKRNVQARFFRLLGVPEYHRTLFPKNKDLGCFLNVKGTAVRVTQSKMLEYQRKYMCVKCKHENTIEAKFENRYILKAPTKCSNDGIRCKCTTFTQENLVSREYCKDYQEVKIQEQVNKLCSGTIPVSMWVVLENDLVDCCKPGDDVNICGTVRRRWRPFTNGKRSEVELVLQANSLEVCNALSSEVIATAPDVKDCFKEYWANYEGCPLKGRDWILASVCPEVYGLHLVKLAVLLTVITGSDHVKESEGKQCVDNKHTDRVRGQCHLLLVGDPGTGKSRVLQAAAGLSARAVLTSGAGSTRAGLTCAALREDSEWALEAGALVLSDGGVCCIDEIRQLREHDRAAIHEAMEQQTVSIAKAGIVCKLNTRCAVIAACNPKGHYQPDEPLSANVALGTPLLSRFDLIFILLDKKNREWDKLVSSYILFGRSDLTKANKKLWNLEKLQAYISLVGSRPTQMSLQANTILQSYYMTQRKSVLRDSSRTTVRMLDSLIRLSQAHCRLMYRTTITPMDAIVAVSLMDLSMQQCTLSESADALHSTFHKHPDFEYLCTAKQLLSKLSLLEIWRKELISYAKLLRIDHKTLEDEIDKGSERYFAKFDDISDDSIPLSSVITSSYFKTRKGCENTYRDGYGKENKTSIKKESDYTEKYDKANDNKECRKGNYHKKNDINEVNKASKELTVVDMKHSSSSKEEMKPGTSKEQSISTKENIIPPPEQNKVTAKRKLKEITLDTSKVSKVIKKPRNTNAKKTKDKRHNFENISDSEEEYDPAKLLNAVPSVNDFMAESNMDFCIDDSLETDTMDYKKHDAQFLSRHSTQNDHVPKKYVKETNYEKYDVTKNHEHTMNNHINQTKFLYRHSTANNHGPKNDVKDINLVENIAKNHEKPIKKESLQDLNTSSSSNTMSKLKRYQYVGKHDLSKYEPEVEKLQTKLKPESLENVPPLQTTTSQTSVIPLQNARNSSNSSSVNSKSIKSSQISMFESSDCDIDLDI